MRPVVDERMRKVGIFFWPWCIAALAVPGCNGRTASPHQIVEISGMRIQDTNYLIEGQVSLASTGTYLVYAVVHGNSNIGTTNPISGELKFEVSFSNDKPNESYSKSDSRVIEAGSRAVSVFPLRMGEHVSSGKDLSVQATFKFLPVPGSEYPTAVSLRFEKLGVLF